MVPGEEGPCLLASRAVARLLDSNSAHASQGSTCISRKNLNLGTRDAVGKKKKRKGKNKRRKRK
jgi:hypothetical protein